MANVVVAATSMTTTWIFVLFCLINLLNYVDRGIIPGAPTQFQFFIKATMNTSVGQESFYLGLLASSFIASYAGFILLFGYLSIFMKPFRLVGIGLFVWCIAVLICGAAKHYNSFYVLLVGRILSGIGESSFQCIAPPFIDDYAPPATRTLWLGVFFACISIGTAVGYEYGALFAESDAGWSWAFNVEALLMAPLALIAFCCIPTKYDRPGNHQRRPSIDEASDATASAVESPASEHEDVPDNSRLIKAKTSPSTSPTGSSVKETSSFFHEAYSVANNLVFVLTVLGSAAFTFSLAGLSVFGPMFLIGLGLFEKESHASVVFGSVVVLAGTIGTPLGGLILDYMCRDLGNNAPMRQYLALKQMFLFMVAGTCLSLIAWASLPSKLWFLLLFGVALVFLFGTTSCTAIAILLCVTPSRRALAVAVNTLLIHLFGDVPSPIILGALKDTLAPDCGSIEVDGQIILNPDCAQDRKGLMDSLLFPLLWMVWTVLLWGMAVLLVQRRLRKQGAPV
ncbi:Major Facilitator Superfamily (MFS) [Thraustotheca clavata]|uniref:Major Facilitator Superfamily (MFS) n=1 Tax=Thraustotheca clavata TaxID=74557 RepID=A0A1V9ZFY5_9STRA|nr:Major Facilitator Superfamily (MFS) [Thraustotheca clavata]